MNPAQSLPNRTAYAAVATGLALWFATIVLAAGSGFLATLPPLVVGPPAVLGMVTPYVVFRRSPSVRAVVERIGLRRLTLFHGWRILATALFFAYGFRGLLPPRLWIEAGVGDLLAGLFGLSVLFGPVSRRRYWAIHLFGFADLVIALGTGIALTLAHEPKMVMVRTLPFALIPLFGVGLSTAVHLMAFDILRRR